MLPFTKVICLGDSIQFMTILLMVSSVTTFDPFNWMKDVFEVEHCGSVWIKPDIDGNEYYNLLSAESKITIATVMMRNQVTYRQLITL